MVGLFDCEPHRSAVQILCRSTLTFTPVVHDWVNKGHGMSGRVGAIGHIQYPVPLIEKSRASCAGGRFPPSYRTE